MGYNLGWRLLIYTYELYSLKNGKKPFEEWLSSLRDRALRVQVLTRLTRIKAGNLGDYKGLGDGLYELRIHYGAGARIYFAVRHECLIILLGGYKSKQGADVEKARKYWEEYRGENVKKW